MTSSICQNDDNLTHTYYNTFSQPLTSRWTQGDACWPALRPASPGQPRLNDGVRLSGRLCVQRACPHIHRLLHKLQCRFVIPHLYSSLDSALQHPIIPSLPSAPLLTQLLSPRAPSGSSHRSHLGKLYLWVHSSNFFP